MATSATQPAARPGLDRFLAAILLGLAALLLVAAGALILARQPAPALPVDTPGGTIQRFYQALDREDYDAAYDLLSNTLKNKPTREAFTEYYLEDRNYYNGHISRLRITEERVRGEVAFVVVQLTHYYNDPGPFGGSSEWNTKETFTLRHEVEIWRISELPYGYRP
jgi:hypothetical protein